MIFLQKSVVCALLAALAFASCTHARPEVSDATASESAAVSTLSSVNVRQIQATLREALPLYRMAAKSAHKEHGHGGKLSVVHLILIIGKVLAPLVGAIIEPLLVNVAKGITWAITYSLATGFDKPPSYEHFVPALEHHGGGGGGGDDDDDDDDDGGVEYESHKPVSYSLKELPGLALQLTSTVLADSGAGQPAQQAEAMAKAEGKLVGLLLQGNKPAPVATSS
ncbi:uncharacterized protein LOC132944833 [Metopolophium dirhodum]|uniref:uncharacterized protein LOC132944833 n=1 Tax=Metopolophium dirhodum TaxID=44670 RepID=UPI00298F9E54|nr:uncharacterized protein LOC132944833 [Metopolophium dirhodum]